MFFRVSPRANKIQIKDAVERLFQKKVVECEHVQLRRQRKASPRTARRRAHWKKAIVTLAEARRSNWCNFMALKNYRPLTPIQRFKQTPAFDEITKWRPTRALIEPKKKSGGRNNYGRLTSRHIGGGHNRITAKSISNAASTVLQPR